MRRLTGAKITTNTMLLASIADGIFSIRWLLSEDSSRGRNRPKSILAALLGEAQGDNSQILGYDSGDAWEEAHRKLIERVTTNV